MLWPQRLCDRTVYDLKLEWTGLASGSICDCEVQIFRYHSLCFFVSKNMNFMSKIKIHILKTNEWAFVSSVPLKEVELCLQFLYMCKVKKSNEKKKRNKNPLCIIMCLVSPLHIDVWFCHRWRGLRGPSFHRVGCHTSQCLRWRWLTVSGLILCLPSGNQTPDLQR